jgi:hypothetical protein
MLITSPPRVGLLAQIGQPLFHRLHFGLQFSEVPFQFGDLLCFGLVATPEPATAAALTFTAALAASPTLTGVVLTMSFIPPHRQSPFL